MLINSLSQRRRWAEEIHQVIMSSRIIIRNLPPTTTPASLRAQLESPQELQGCVITDCKVVAKRRFAFVGYRTGEEARRVREWWEGAFVGGSRVKVEEVREEALGPRHASRAQPAAPSDDTPKPAPSTAKDERLQEFMDVMKNKDVTDPSQLAPPTEASNPAESGVAGIEEVAEELDDAEWLRRRQEQAAGKAVEAPETAPADTTKSTSSHLSPEEQQILLTGRLFIRNLSFLTTSDDVSSAFSGYGALEEVHLPLSQGTQQPLGTAFVQFKDPQAAVNAWKELDGRTLMGRLVHILPGRPKHGAPAVDTDAVISGKVMGKDTERNVKADIDKKRKEQSGKGLNWATLYMNSDAVASSVAARMGISKADILNADSTLRSTQDDDGKLAGVGSAVKLALAETSVIAETKAYFEDHGVVLDRLTETSDAQGKPKRTPRSRTMLLVKNIPYGTDVALLTGLFEPHGTIRRLLLPPAGTLAVVEYENEDDASRAFKAVNYRRLGSAVIYLEKAPEGLIDDERPVASDDRQQVQLPTNEADVVRQRVEAVGQQDDDAPAEAGSTLFVKNLSFTTTTERLQSVFSSLPAYSFARVSTKPDPKNPTGPRLSMGFGFVGFATRDAAAKAMQGLKGFKLDGHDLEFKYAMRDAGEEAKESKADAVAGKAKSKSTKMIVKNVPFEASKKDIRDLFSAFGTLKSCRLPKKHNSTGRGFAFLDFTTRHEAEAAMNALKHTHLLGRHLVLEWAESEGDLAAQEVERLRQKTKSQFVADGQSGGPSKKRKLDLRGETDPDDVDV